MSVSVCAEFNSPTRRKKQANLDLATFGCQSWILNSK